MIITQRLEQSFKNDYHGTIEFIVFMFHVIKWNEMHVVIVNDKMKQIPAPYINDMRNQLDEQTPLNLMLRLQWANYLRVYHQKY